MELDTQVQDIVAAWRSVVKEYSERPENRQAMDTIAFEHWTLFWRLLVSCVPSVHENHGLWFALNDWKKEEREAVLQTLKVTLKDEHGAWRAFSALLAQARGHGQCATPPDGLDGIIKRAKVDTMPCPSSEADPDETVVCDVDREVLRMLEKGDPHESLRVESSRGSRPRIRLASTMLNFPPPPPLPTNSYFRLKEGAGGQDAEFADEEVTTLGQKGR